MFKFDAPVAGVQNLSPSCALTVNAQQAAVNCDRLLGLVKQPTLADTAESPAKTAAAPVTPTSTAPNGTQEDPTLALARRMVEAGRERDAEALARAQADAHAAGPGGDAYVQGDFKTACAARYGDSCALLAWKNGCDSGVADGCRKMGSMYWNGYGPIASDKSRALSFHERACRLDATVCLDLGVVAMSSFGSQHEQAMEDRIRTFFSRACTVGADTCAQACETYANVGADLSRVSPTPRPLLDQRIAFTRSCRTRACAAGNATACSMPH